MIDNLQTIGTDAVDAYRDLLAENLQRAERKFEKVFCYKIDKPVMESKQKALATSFPALFVVRNCSYL